MKTSLGMLVGGAVWVLVGGIMLSSSAFAGRVVAISKRSVVVPVTITPENLRWSAADYRMPVVKVLVPELADLTILNHRNFREGAPCLATYSKKTPEEIIAGRPNREPVRFLITLEKETVLSEDGQTCQVRLIERLNANIRGVPFVHERFLAAPDRVAADCR